MISWRHMSSVSFDQAEAQVVARALAAVAAADGAIKAREENFLEGFAVTHGVGGHAHIAAALDENALAHAVRDPERRREVLRLCLKMAHADRVYEPREAAVIARIARAFGVSDEELEKLRVEVAA